MAAERMQIFVKVSNSRSLTMKVPGPQYKVLDLQSELCARIGIEPLDQQLVYGGRPLRRHGKGDRSQAKMSLADHGIQNGSTIFMLGNIRGGATLGKPRKGFAGKTGEVYYDSAANEEQEREILKRRKQLDAAMETERKNSHMNRLKIQNQWRKIMRIAKVETLQKDIEILSQVRNLFLYSTHA